MAEETTKSRRSAPFSIVWTCVATALTGFCYTLGLLYAMNGDINDVMNGNNNQPIVNVFSFTFLYKDGTPNKQGALAMTSLLVINLFFAGFSSLTVTSRIGFAMARDGAFLGSKCLKVVNKKTQTPIATIFMVFIIDALLCLLPMGSS